jgi:hypothetical protein
VLLVSFDHHADTKVKVKFTLEQATTAQRWLDPVIRQGVPTQLFV